MQAGDVVVSLEDPLYYGQLLIREVTKDNNFICETVHPDERGEHPRYPFRPHEVELYTELPELEPAKPKARTA
jgi:hypothetical protein